MKLNFKKNSYISSIIYSLFLILLIHTGVAGAEENKISFGEGTSVDASDLYGIADFKIGLDMENARNLLSAKKIKYELINGVEGNPNKSSIFISVFDCPALKSLKGSDSLHTGAKLKLFFYNNEIYQIVYNVMSTKTLLKHHQLTTTQYIEKTLKMNIEPTIVGVKGTLKTFSRNEGEIMGMKTIEMNCQLNSTRSRMSIVENDMLDMVDFQFIIEKR